MWREWRNLNVEQERVLNLPLPPIPLHHQGPGRISFGGESKCLRVHREDSLRVDREMREDPGKDGGKVGRRLGMTLDSHR